jgi:hypothetical protein
MGECTSCGAEIDYRDKFCSSCGALTAIGRPITEQIGQAVAQIAEAVSKLAGEFAAYVRDEANRKPVIIGSCVLALLLLALTDNPVSKGFSGLFDDEAQAPQLTAEGLPDFANYEDVFLAEEAEFAVTGPANVRDYPTSQDTQVVRTFHGDVLVQARQVQAFDPSSQWYKLSDGGYVWGGNLVHIDEPTGINQITFHSNLHGRWSSMDTCNGPGPDAIVDISEREIRIHESLGQLKRVSKDARGNDVYHINFSSVHEDWLESLRMSRNANGLTFVPRQRLWPRFEVVI